MIQFHTCIQLWHHAAMKCVLSFDPTYVCKYTNKTKLESHLIASDDSSVHWAGTH